MNFIRLIKFKYLLISLLIALVSCGDNSQFRVTGTVNGLGTQNLRVIYYTNTGIKSLTATAVDGKFDFVGNAPNETLVEIFTSDRVPLMHLAIKNGETVEVKIDRNHPYQLKVKGNDTAKRLAEFMHTNSTIFDSADHDAINRIISIYIGQHPKDLVSTILLLTEYSPLGHEEEADSLLKLIDADVRPDFLIENLTAELAETDSIAMKAKLMPLRLYTTADSMTTYKASGSAYSLLIFTRTNSERPDSMRNVVTKLLNDYDKKKLRVADISIATDSAAWHSQLKIKTESKGYISAWMPGAIAAIPLTQLAVTHTPFFIVADSTGTQIYRGASLTKVRKVLAK